MFFSSPLSKNYFFPHGQFETEQVGFVQPFKKAIRAGDGRDG
jgi:hypothetical protein